MVEFSWFAGAQIGGTSGAGTEVTRPIGLAISASRRGRSEAFIRPMSKFLRVLESVPQLQADIIMKILAAIIRFNFQDADPAHPVGEGLNLFFRPVRRNRLLEDRLCEQPIFESLQERRAPGSIDLGLQRRTACNVRTGSFFFQEINQLMA